MRCVDVHVSRGMSKLRATEHSRSECAHTVHLVVLVPRKAVGPREILLAARRVGPVLEARPVSRVERGDALLVNVVREMKLLVHEVTDGEEGELCAGVLSVEGWRNG